MKLQLKTVAMAILAVSLFASCAYATDATPPAKKHAATKKEKTPPPPSVEDQIQALRQEMQGQIDSLKTNLADKDAQLKQAEQKAADAQAAASRAQAAADAQQQVYTQNQAAVSTLQSTVNDLKANEVSLATTVSDSTASLKKEIAEPDAIHYKGITLSPAGSFLAAETVWRNAATASDINTDFKGVPLQNSEAAQLSEWFASARQTRVALKATGKVGSVSATGYYEADFLSAGITSNNNQSNSYTLRQRELWADAKFANGWDVSGGTGWSLATENSSGVTRGTQVTPGTIDAQYTAGFVWTRQESLRLAKSLGKKAVLAVAAENPETLNPGGNNLPTFVLIGSAGDSSGLFNGAGSAAASTVANYSFNYMPDWIVKLAIEPGWGHWELINIDRVFRDRIYPNTANTLTAATNDSELGYGFGGSFRGALAQKKVSVGLKGLWGYGMGRYGNSTIADITLRPNGYIEPLESFSGLGSLDINPTSKLNIYFNYGGDYVYRDWVLNAAGTTQVGYGNYSADMSGCGIEAASTAANPTSDPTTPGNSTNACKGNNKDVQEFTAGYWFYFFNNTHGRFRQGIQYSLIRRDLWSGAGGTLNPGGGAHGDDNMIFTSFRYYLP
jgi:Skp family chaperone for outer membrane proteins